LLRAIVNYTFLFLGGVIGLESITVFLAFVMGLRILKLHMRFSSIDIIAPALSNSPQ
jgi:hypothetical protein